MMSMFRKLLKQDELTFDKLEQLMWQSALKTFQQVLHQVLEDLDQHLMAARDTRRCVLKDRKPRTVQTLVGDVTVTRRYYWDRELEQWCFLLDEALGLPAGDRVSPGLRKLAVTWAVKGPSYRDARDRVRDVYGAQRLSHEQIRQEVLRTARGIERHEANVRVTREGQREVEALFLEVDGLHVPMQGGGSQEAKVVVIHEGWEHRQGVGDGADYRLVNAHYLGVFETSEALWEQVRGYVASRYAHLDEMPVVINGDGANWIRPGASVFGQGFYQYDRYHLTQLVREALGAQPGRRRRDMGTLASEVMAVDPESLSAESYVKWLALRTLLADHHEVLRDYRLQLQEAGLAVKPCWRTMGAAESNVDRFDNRLGKRGRAWCPEGAQGMLTALTKLFEGRLTDFVARPLEELQEWVLDRVEQGAGVLARSMTRPSIGVQTGHFPALDHGTDGFAPLFRRVVRFQSP